MSDQSKISAGESVSGEERPRREELMIAIADELDHAYAKHGTEQWGRHEFYAILLEEVNELWDAIKADLPQEEVEAELKQVAAMCFRYYETGDRYRQPITTPPTSDKIPSGTSPESDTK